MTNDETTQQLAQHEQSLEQLSYQKKQFKNQLLEAQAAIDALQEGNDSYKIIGNLMIKQSKEELEKELKEKISTLQVRIATIEKQEEKIRVQVKELQEEMMKKIKK